MFAFTNPFVLSGVAFAASFLVIWALYAFGPLKSDDDEDSNQWLYVLGGSTLIAIIVFAIMFFKNRGSSPVLLAPDTFDAI